MPCVCTASRDLWMPLQSERIPPSYCPARCNALSPCLANDSIADVARISVHGYCAGVDRAALGQAVAHFKRRDGRPPHVCLMSPSEHWLTGRGGRELRQLESRPGVLHISGPVNDGFFVRCLVVMAHTAWAWHLGLAVTVAFRSPHDPYLDSADALGDGWTQYFEPIFASLPAAIKGATGATAGAVPAASSAPSASSFAAATAASSVAAAASRKRRPSSLGAAMMPRYRLECNAAARAWEGFANYATTHASAMTQRAERSRLVRTLPIEPLPTYRRQVRATSRMHVCMYSGR